MDILLYRGYPKPIWPAKNCKIPDLSEYTVKKLRIGFNSVKNTLFHMCYRYHMLLFVQSISPGPLDVIKQ